MDGRTDGESQREGERERERERDGRMDGGAEGETEKERARERERERESGREAPPVAERRSSKGLWLRATGPSASDSTASVGLSTASAVCPYAVCV